MTYEQLIPAHSAISWDDVYRFATNNVIGRKRYQPYVNKYRDAGKCLGALADSIGCNPTAEGRRYFPANYWKIVYKYNLSEDQYFSSVKAIAEDLTKQRDSEDEPYEYWEFVTNNCLRLMEEAFRP